MPDPTTKAPIRWRDCRPTSTGFATWLCAARPISRTIKSDAPGRRKTRSNTPTVRFWNGSCPLSIISSSAFPRPGAKAKSRPIYSGMNLVLKQINDFLTESGLQPIDAVGRAFDPNLHEAIAHEPSEEVPENQIIRQTRRGYRFKDRLLRPSSVVVSSGPGSRSEVSVDRDVDGLSQLDCSRRGALPPGSGHISRGAPVISRVLSSPSFLIIPTPYPRNLLSLRKQERRKNV